MIVSTKFLDHIDLSWAKLTPRLLLQISEALVERQIDFDQKIRNVNLSYNSLCFSNEEGMVDQEEFTDNLCTFVADEDSRLNHVDLSGMNFSNDALLQLCTALSSSDSLLAIHLSDNGLNLQQSMGDNDLTMEILDLFIADLKADDFKPLSEFEYNINKKISNGNKLKDVVKEWTGDVSTSEIENKSPRLNASSYQKHFFLGKQGRSIRNNQMMNRTQAFKGIGRLDSNLIDDFILTRKVNHAELVFNHQFRKDEYWDQDAGEQCVLQD